MRAAPTIGAWRSENGRGFIRRHNTPRAQQGHKTIARRNGNRGKRRPRIAGANPEMFRQPAWRIFAAARPQALAGS
ncbi:MAG: hypothetical protein OXU61_08845 [Gammaproteobacteria bacterium]|nr:hypothetical protein [Gammaproteobacteria bacterium]